LKLKPKLLIAGILTVIAVLVAGYWGMRDGAKETPYLTAPVQRGDITQVVTATGSLQAVVTVQVGSQISGTIDRLYADFNSNVKKDQPIAQLNQDKFKASVDQAKANVLAGQANLVKARVSVDDTRRTMERNRELRQRNLISQSDLDSAQAAYDAAVAQLDVNQAQVAQAQASLNQAAVDLNNTTVRSPVDGIVVSRSVDVGQTVAASLQAPVLFLIANDLAKMQVDTNVSESDVGNVWMDQEVNFTVDAYPARRFQGKVLQVRNAPIMVQNVVTYDAVVGVDNKELLLKPGMTANVEFLVSGKSDALKIPNAALRFRPTEDKAQPQAAASGDRAGQGGSSGAGRGGNRAGQGARSRGEGRGGREATVYVLRDEKATPVKVRVGITDGTSTEVVTDALKEGEQVVVAMSTTGKQPATAPGGRRLFGF